MKKIFYWTLMLLLAGSYSYAGVNDTTIRGSITATGGIAAAGGFASTPRNFGACGMGGAALSVAGSYTSQTPVTTEFYYVEVFVPANVSITGIAVYNSATISGNMKVGLFNSSGVVVATSASTAMAGTSVFQRVPFTATYSAVGPATYFIGVFYDNNTVRPNTLTQGNCAVSVATGQTYATGFTTISPATTFTTALGPVAALY